MGLMMSPSNESQPGINGNQPGIMQRFSNWMTPERAAGFQALGMGLSQLGSGQPVNLSPAYEALQQRQMRSQQQQMLEQSGVMQRFSPEERAFIAQIPDPNAAMRIIAERIFAPEPQQEQYQLVTGDQATALGLPPGAYNRSNDGKYSAIGGGDTIIQNIGPTGIDYGSPPTDMAWLRNPDGSVRSDERGAPLATYVANSPTDRAQVAAITETASGAIDAAERAERQQGQSDVSSDVVLNAALRARDASQDRAVGGLFGKLASYNPSSQNAELDRQVNVLRANAASENINAMRAASPTGGALGNASDADIRLLQDKSGALDPFSPNFERDLADYTRTLLATIHGPEAGHRIFEETWNRVDPENAPMDRRRALDLLLDN